MDKEKLNDIVCESSSDYDILNDAYNYIESLEQQCKQQKEVIDKAINDIDLVIELIKQQPTEDDSWILSRLNAFKIILKEVSE